MIAFNAIHAEISWTLYDDGTLTISGTDIPNYDFNEIGDGSNNQYYINSPWYSQREKIKKNSNRKWSKENWKLCFL